VEGVDTHKSLVHAGAVDHDDPLEGVDSLDFGRKEKGIWSDAFRLF
jgi:hypothetical protein